MWEHCGSYHCLQSPLLAGHTEAPEEERFFPAHLFSKERVSLGSPGTRGGQNKKT